MPAIERLHIMQYAHHLSLGIAFCVFIWHIAVYFLKIWI